MEIQECLTVNICDRNTFWSLHYTDSGPGQVSFRPWTVFIKALDSFLSINKTYILMCFKNRSHTGLRNMHMNSEPTKVER